MRRLAPWRLAPRRVVSREAMLDGSRGPAPGCHDRLPSGGHDGSRSPLLAADPDGRILLHRGAAPPAAE